MDANVSLLALGLESLSPSPPKVSQQYNDMRDFIYSKAVTRNLFRGGRGCFRSSLLFISFLPFPPAFPFTSPFPLLLPTSRSGPSISSSCESADGERYKLLQLDPLPYSYQSSQIISPSCILITKVYYCCCNPRLLAERFSAHNMSIQ